MALKYQVEIDNFTLINCPKDGAFAPTSDFEAFRFSFSPIGHEDNFLPNVVFDRKRKNPINYNAMTNEKKCKRCGASFYVNYDDAMSQWNGLTPKVKENLGYTHLAKGLISITDGQMLEPENNGHFTFYEDERAELRSKFALMAEL
jgi:hypothetical protein